MKTVVTSPELPPPVGPFSPAIATDGWIFLSGQGGFDPASGSMISDDVAEQTAQTFRNIKALLSAAGAGLADVVSCLVHLVDLDDYPQFNQIYAAQFPDAQPVRTTVRADLVAGMRVEITVIARKV